jgi:hypothetical protein
MVEPMSLLPGVVAWSALRDLLQHRVGDAVWQSQTDIRELSRPVRRDKPVCCGPVRDTTEADLLQLYAINRPPVPKPCLLAAEFACVFTDLGRAGSYGIRVVPEVGN